MDENLKVYATVALVLVALVSLGYFVTSSSKDQKKKFKEIPTKPEEVLRELYQNPKVLILMDLRNASPKVRRNIMQCGVDLAGSPGLAGKNITVGSIEGNMCYLSSSVAKPRSYPASYCLNLRAQNATTTLYVWAGNTTQAFQHELKIGVGENYTVGTCKIELG